MAQSKHYLIDMDGVLISGRSPIPGANQFIERLQARGIEYLVLTNNPVYTPRDLSHRLRTIGLSVPAERIFTSAMATARFIQSQKPNGTAFVIGESGLTEAIHDVGYIITDHQPDYVVLGETHTYNLEMITQAIRLVIAGARFIATNPDPSGPGEGGIVPACG
ncbi:MAG: TIGR01457 family HAD-type hydrolase, partial [Anaerolineae bacterium]|nr:TIGR01457 family HAD-type hydrolase [Anaerolineae bacterium]